MSYTAEEKAAGRHFRAEADKELGWRFRTDPPTFEAPHFLAVYGHTCTDGRSIGMELKEVYQPSPAYEVVSSVGNVWVVIQVDEDGALRSQPGMEVTVVPAGRFGFIHRSGRCRGCGRTARSRTGRLCDGWDRPPIAKRR